MISEEEGGKGGWRKFVLRGLKKKEKKEAGSGWRNALKRERE